MAKTYPPSDHQRLAEARHALADHLARRPATSEECRTLAAAYRDRAAAGTAEVVALRALAATYSGNPGLLARAAEFEHAVLRMRLHGDAWAAIADDPAADYAKATRLYEERIAHYQGRIDARAAARETAP